MLGQEARQLKGLKLTRLDRAILVTFAAYVLLLTALPFTLEHDMFRFTFSETGPFERLSLFAWLACAAVIIVRVRPYTKTAAAFTVLYVLFAAREADLHKAFTTRSISKLNYYKDTSIPALERIFAALVAIAILCLILYALFIIVRFLFWRGGLRTRSGMWLAIGAGVLVFGKILDRSAAVLTQVFHVIRPEWVKGLTDSFEEGLELATPILLAVSAWISQREASYLRSRAPPRQ